MSAAAMPTLGRLLSAAAGWSGPPSAPATEDGWQALDSLATHHRLRVWLSRQPGLTPPAALAAEWDAEGSLASRAALVRLEAMDRLHALFLRHGISAVFLKGAVLAPRLYPAVDQRSLRDADVWIRPDAEAERAQRLLRDEGWRLRREMPPGHHHLSPLFDLSQALTVEIHTNLAAPALPDAALEALWARRAPADPLPRLDEVGLTLHQALHTLNDPVDGPVLRDLWETARLYTGLSSASFADLWAFACAHRLEGSVAAVLERARALFDAPLDIPAPGKRSCAVRLLDRRLRGIEPVSRFGRLLRHLDEVTLERSQQKPARGWCAHRAGAELRLAAELAGALAQRVRRKFLPRYARTEGPTLRLDDATLLHDRESGAVHLLNATAAAVHAACVRPVTAGELRQSLPGVPEAERKAGLAALVAGGVIRRQ